MKVILTETGYALGTNTFGFEGFSAINETNRADYIRSAFRDYWQNWPEVIAVTPFQMADPSGHWHAFDWINPAPPYTPHPQYTAVASLPKPDGGLEPYGFQIIFKARVSPDLPAGNYPAILHGSERYGAQVTASPAATLTVRASTPAYTYYLPLIFGPTRRDGPWYLSAGTAPSPGAIAPTAYLSPADLATASLHEIQQIQFDQPPLDIVFLPAVQYAGAVLADGSPVVLNLQTGQRRALPLDTPAHRLAPSGNPGRIYVALDNALALVDLPAA
ncbi:MAG: hypothetical protein D6784_11100, partial [Chloroflexi bacterium]